MDQGPRRLANRLNAKEKMGRGAIRRAGKDDSRHSWRGGNDADAAEECRISKTARLTSAPTEISGAAREGEESVGDAKGNERTTEALLGA